MTIQAHRPFLGAEAERYDAAYDADTLAGRLLRARLAAVVAALGPGEGEILDAGMGPGRLCTELARRGWTVSGVDSSSGMVDRARERLPEAAERLLCGELEDLPFPDAGFDAVVASGALEYAQDRQRALAELAGVLRPGGIAVVTVPNPASMYAAWQGNVVYPAVRLAKRLVPSRRPAPVRRKRLPRRRFTRMLVEAGLSLESLDYTGYLVLPSPLDTLLPKTTIRIADRLERGQPRFGPALGTQMVFRARKT